LALPFNLGFYFLIIKKTPELWIIIPITLLFTIIGLLIKKKSTAIYFGIYAIIIGLNVSLLVFPEITSNEVDKASSEVVPSSEYPNYKHKMRKKRCS